MAMSALQHGVIQAAIEQLDQTSELRFIQNITEKKQNSKKDWIFACFTRFTRLNYVIESIVGFYKLVRRVKTKFTGSV